MGSRDATGRDRRPNHAASSSGVRCAFDSIGRGTSNREPARASTSEPAQPRDRGGEERNRPRRGAGSAFERTERGRKKEEARRGLQRTDVVAFLLSPLIILRGRRAAGPDPSSESIHPVAAMSPRDEN